MRPFAILLVSTAALVAADSIGTAAGLGSFSVNGSRVSTNATLFDGATVETARASSRLRLNSGTRVELGPASRAKVSGSRLILEKGATDIAPAAGFTVEARELRIAPGSAATASVKLEGERAVLIAAANGPVRVYNRLGDLLANVRAGSALSVMPPAAAQADGSSLSGCLLKKDGRYILTDTTANVTVELRGANLEPNVGKPVKIDGTVFRTATPVAGASQVLRVSNIAVTEGGPCEQPASAAQPQTVSSPKPVSAPKPPAAAGGSKVSGAMIAVIVAGAGGGAAAAALALGGDNKSR
ncbi:MAG: hypothetical protein R2729_24590 [Bryobacteraceae bacterium]